MAVGPAKFVHEGSAIDYTPVADAPVGSVVLQGDLVGIAVGPLKTGQPASLAVAGVFDFTKASGAGSAIPAGTNTYWDPVGQFATKSTALPTSKLIGKAVRSAVDGDATVRVKLTQ